MPITVITDTPLSAVSGKDVSDTLGGISLLLDDPANNPINTENSKEIALLLQRCRWLISGLVYTKDQEESDENELFDLDGATKAEVVENHLYLIQHGYNAPGRASGLLRIEKTNNPDKLLTTQQRVEIEGTPSFQQIWAKGQAALDLGDQYVGSQDEIYGTFVASIVDSEIPASDDDAVVVENKELREKAQEALIGQRVLRNTIAELEADRDNWIRDVKTAFTFYEFREQSADVLLSGFKAALSTERDQHNQQILAKNAQIEQLSAELLQKHETTHDEDYLRLFDSNLHPELWDSPDRSVRARSTAPSESRGRSASPDQRPVQKRERQGSAVDALRRLLAGQ